MTEAQYDVFLVVLIAFCLGMVIGILLKLCAQSNTKRLLGELYKASENLKIGSEVYIHGYVDEIRSDNVIIKNAGGYFGTDKNEIYFAKMQD